MRGGTLRSSELAGRLKGFFAGEAEGVVSAYLFGSHARGQAHRESDVDVAVLLDETRSALRRERHEARERLISALIHALRVNLVDLVVLNDAPPLLARRIITTGQRVFCADAEDDRVFARDVMLRAADLAPFLARAARVKLVALRP